MKTFISDISQKEFPNDECIKARSIRQPIFDIIKKNNPNFSEESLLSVQELNVYREKYISGYLINDLDELSSLRENVLSSLKENVVMTDKLAQEEKTITTFGEKIADKVATFGGSWTFIITFLSFLVVWILINVFIFLNKGFDPYPFILLNLILSCIAALQAPVIMMSQNRQEQKDRERSKKDYMINLKSELEIRMLHEKVDHLIMHQQQELIEIQKVQIDMMNDILKNVQK
jgi:uncharacterized membrane protein